MGTMADYVSCATEVAAALCRFADGHVECRSCTTGEVSVGHPHTCVQDEDGGLGSRSSALASTDLTQVPASYGQLPALVSTDHVQAPCGNHRPQSPTPSLG